MKRVLIFFSFVLTCAFTLAPPQVFAGQQDPPTGERKWVEFTTESGLPSDHVYFLNETKDGTVWVGTALGFAWYDGYRWCRVDTPLALKGGRVWGMSPYSRDSLMVMAGDGLYVGNRHGFHRFQVKNITSALEYSENKLLLCIHNSLYTCIDGQVEPLLVDSQLTRGKTYALIKSDVGKAYAVLQNGLYRMDSTGWAPVLPVTSGRLRLKTVAENEQGTLLALVMTPIEQRGLLQLKHNKVAVLRYWTSGDYVVSADIGANDKLIIATESGELEFVEPGVTTYLEPPSSGFRNIEFVQFRKNNDIWVGTTTGLYLYLSVPPRWSYLPTDSLNVRNRIHEILRTKDGSLWTATAYGLVIFRKDGRREAISEIDHRMLADVTGLAEDDEGKIWISSGSSFDGAYCFDGNRWKHFAVSDDSEGVQFHKIRKDRAGRLWFLGLGKNAPLPGAREPGATVYEKGVFTHWGKEKGLLGWNVYSFDEFPDGSLVFGSMMSVGMWKNGAWQYWTPATGLSGGGFTLAVDADNTIWVGDRNNGITAISNDGKISYYTVQNGLVDNSVWDIKVGPGGKVWFSTDDGLGCYDHGTWSSFGSQSGLVDSHLWPVLPVEDRVYVGTRNSGVAVLNLNNTTQPFPRIYLEKPIIEGTSAYIRWSTSMPWNEVPPKDILTRYRIGSEPWSPWSTARRVTYDKLPAEEITFEIQAQNLLGTFDPAGMLGTFRILPPFYGRLEFLVPVVGSTMVSLGFGVMLLRRRRKHAAAILASEAKFRRLTEATFEGIFIHDSGVILDANQSILNMLGYSHTDFVGQPAMFFIAHESRDQARESIFSDSGKIYEAVGIRTDGTRIDLEVMGKTIPYDNRMASVTAVRDITERKHAEQQLIAYQSQLRSLALEFEAKEERERRRMATYLHDYIGQTLALCKIKLGSLPDPSLSPPQLSHLQEIRTLLEQMIGNTHSLTFELSPPVLYELGFGDAIEWLAEQIQEQHGIEVACENDDKPKPLREEVRILLFHAVRELLVNVVKHAHAKHAKIILKKTYGTIEISVEDDGEGFSQQSGDPPGSVGQTSGSSPDNRGGGFGLFNIRERITQLGGRIEISSSPGKGTRVTLWSPLSPGTSPER